jgi:hypothetical protein
MVVPRPVLVSVLPGQDLAPAGSPYELDRPDPGPPRYGSRPHIAFAKNYFLLLVFKSPF